jgi:hypothetical protein
MDMTIINKSEEALPRTSFQRTVAQGVFKNQAAIPYGNVRVEAHIYDFLVLPVNSKNGISRGVNQICLRVIGFIRVVNLSPRDSEINVERNFGTQVSHFINEDEVCELVPIEHLLNTRL